jgi:hypothetical protein
MKRFLLLLVSTAMLGCGNEGSQNAEIQSGLAEDSFQLEKGKEFAHCAEVVVRCSMVLEDFQPAPIRLTAWIDTLNQQWSSDFSQVVWEKDSASGQTHRVQFRFSLEADSASHANLHMVAFTDGDDTKSLVQSLEDIADEASMRVMDGKVAYFAGEEDRLTSQGDALKLKAANSGKEFKGWEGDSLRRINEQLSMAFQDRCLDSLALLARMVAQAAHAEAGQPAKYKENISRMLENLSSMACAEAKREWAATCEPHAQMEKRMCEWRSAKIRNDALRTLLTPPWPTGQRAKLLY